MCIAVLAGRATPKYKNAGLPLPLGFFDEREARACGRVRGRGQRRSRGGGDDSLDVDRLIQDLDKRKRGAPKGAEPAWRKLERLLEQKRTSELLSDFDDYDLGDKPRPRRPREAVASG